MNAIWEVVSAPFRGIHGLGSIFPSDFDGSNLINGTTSQFEVHPSKPVYEIIEFNIGILGVEGKVYAHLNYELKLIVPLDKQRKNMMT